MDAPYKTGDYIILESGERGVVTHIGLRSTRLLTRDDIEITIPNGIIGNSKIVNDEVNGLRLVEQLGRDAQVAKAQFNSVVQRLLQS